MDFPLSGFPKSAIPQLGTQAYTLIVILLDGEEYTTTELTQKLIGKNPRSALQALQDETFNYWNIHNIGVTGSSEGRYRLDSRHFSNNPDFDQHARRDRFIALLEEKKDKDQKAAGRCPASLERWEIESKASSNQIDLPLHDPKEPA
jgi:hypothetical protein